MKVTEDQINYFMGLGFDSVTNKSSDESMVGIVNMSTGVHVSIYADGSAEICAFDGFIKSTTGLFSFPNENVRLFIDKIEKHSDTFKGGK